jgi:protoporphyrinogen/coproporphyrinogen III oxidase
LDGFGLLVPEVEKRKILGALFISTLFPERCPKDQVLLTVYIGGTRQPQYAFLPKEKMVPMVLEELKTMLGISSEPIHVFHRFWEKAIPQYEVGYGSVRSRLDELEASHSGLHFCGNYRDGISVADTILQALRMSEKLLKNQD